MRIPSQFNEDNLYRRGPRRGESMKYQRRLLRLLIALGIVLVVMRQASKPAIYQPFLKPRMLSTERAAPDGRVDASSVAFASIGTDIPVDPIDRDVANQLVDVMSAAQQRQWVVALSRWQSGQPIQSIPSSLESTKTRLSSILPDDGDRSARWEAMIDSVGRGPQVSRPTSEIQPIVAALLSALDTATAARVVDGSVWRKGDFDTFYRYLDQADDLPIDGVVSTGVLPLLQQPEVFRNQRLRFHGYVVRAERIDASENPYGIEHYWQLWLRPSEGADRPLVAIVPAVPDDVGAALDQDADQDADQEGPRVAIVGRFLKRLAYESSLGADLAPVLIGRVIRAPVAATQRTTAVASEPSASFRFWSIVVLASAVGFGLAAVAMWRTSVMAQRTRALRRDHRGGPDDFFLKGLRESSETADAGETE